jgi:hypothetical protein
MRRMNRQARIALTLGACLAAAFTYVSAQKDPFTGTWVLNVAKSKYSPGPAPKSATTVIEASGTGYTFTVKQTPATGAAQEWSFTTNLDGKPAKMTGNNPNADSVTYKRIDPATLESVSSRNGKETTRQRVVVSADGKTRTVTTTGVDGAGQKINNVAVYEKK